MTITKSPNQIMRDLANRVKFLRLHRQWTRQDLAEAAKINVYSLKRFERTGDISLARLLAICEALGVLHDFNHILKPRERINIEEWKMSARVVRQRGRRRQSVADEVREPMVLESVE
jgi:transcriptional regulator with XRE-family HTH domain